MNINDILEWYKDKIDLTNAPPISDRKMKAISLFSGIAGIDIAMELCNIETVAFCDNSPFSHRILKERWNAFVFDEIDHEKNIQPLAEGKTPIFTDVTTLTKEMLLSAKIQPEEIECIHGGFCCQPYSVMGQRRGDQDERHLYPAMVRFITSIKPKLILGENVVGFKSMGLDGLSADLESAGYDTRAFVLPALGQNAPHPRYRVFITGFEKDSIREDCSSDNIGRGTTSANVATVSKEVRGDDETGQERRNRNSKTTENIEGGSLSSDAAGTGFNKDDEAEQSRWVQCDKNNFNGRDIFQPGLPRLRPGNARWLSNDYKECIKALGNMVNVLQVYPVVRHLRHVYDLCVTGDPRIETYEERLERAQTFVDNLKGNKLDEFRDKFATCEEKIYSKVKCNPKVCRQYNPFKIESLNK